MYLLPLLVAANAKPVVVTPPDRPTVPILDMATLAGCTGQDLALAVTTIDDTIQVGAPLYNAGNRPACYRLYLGAATDLAQHLGTCPGLQNALTSGITRASTLPDYTSQAWAMRDTFDGVIYLYERVATDAAAAPKAVTAPTPTVHER